MKRTFSRDVYGFYILPFIAYSKTPGEGRCIWFGLGPWLWSWQIAPYAEAA
jgi:hypothetical protein